MTARDAVAAAVDALTAAGVDTPRLDAEVLIADALGVDRSALVIEPSLAVPGAAARLIGERVRRRVAREPVAYILGVKGFRRIVLQVDSRVLIPGPRPSCWWRFASRCRPVRGFMTWGPGRGRWRWP